jgi:3-hydroxybutyryl-CoA dehydratase
MKKGVTQEDINLYAKASRDFNPIHIDEEFARKTPAGGTIAHGMLILAYVSQMMTGAFGRSWLSGGRFNIRFKTPARPGDVLTIQGRIEKIQKETEQTVVNCSVLCANQKNESVITGEATVRVKND